MLVPDLACDLEGLLSETNMKMIEALPIEQLVVSLPFAALRRARRPRPLLAAALGSGPPCSHVSRFVSATDHQYCSPKTARSGVLENSHARREPYNRREHPPDAQRREHIAALWRLGRRGGS